MTEHDDLIISKVDLKYLSEDIKEIKQDVKEIKSSCACRIKNCTANFIQGKTVWKLAGLGGVLLGGLATVVFYLAKLHVGG